MTDEKIIGLFFSRDEEAIRALDEKYGARLRTISSRILNDERMAEECVNDAYLAIWNNIPPEAPSPLFPYIFKITKKLSIKRYSKESAEKRNSRYDVALSEIEECISSQETPEDAAEASELRAYIEGFLDRERVENRVIFIRRYIFLDSYSEISNLTGLSEKTVSVRLVRLRRALRKYLIKKGINV